MAGLWRGKGLDLWCDVFAAGHRSCRSDDPAGLPGSTAHLFTMQLYLQALRSSPIPYSHPLPPQLTVLPDGRAVATWLKRNNWVTSVASYGTVWWNCYPEHTDFPDQPILDVAAGPDGRLWFVGASGIFTHGANGYVRLPNSLTAPEAIAASNQGPTLVLPCSHFLLQVLQSVSCATLT